MGEKTYTDPSIGRDTDTNIRSIFQHIPTIFKQCWETSPSLFFGILTVSFALALMPAAFAIVIRALVNEVSAILNKDIQSFRLLMVWLALAFAVTLLETVGNFANKYFSQRLSDQLNLRITTDILTHAATLDVSYFEDSRFQDMMERAQQGTAQRFSQFVLNILSAITNIMQVISLTTILIVIEPIVTLVLVPVAGPYLCFQWRLAQARYSKDYSRATKQRWTRYFVTRLIKHDSVPEVKLFNLAPLLIQKFKSIMTEFRNQDRQLYMRDLFGNILFALFSVIAFYVTFLRVIFRVAEGGLTIGDVAIYGGATARLRNSIENAIITVTTAMEHTLHISNLYTFLSLKPRIKGNADLAPPLSQGDVQLLDVTFAYPGSNRPAIHNISLHIRPGETVALVGENGAGKTTLVKLISRLYDPDEGAVLFNGIDVRNFSPEYFHNQIAFVFQSFSRYEATAYENIAYGDWRNILNDAKRIEHIAKLAGAHEMIQAMPKGYDTPLGRLFGKYNLSDGQWQQMAIARAIARDTFLLVLDEPTSNLDARAEYKLFSRFREMAKGRTTILISHRFTTVSIADRILVMDKGRIIEHGTHDELTDQKGLYSTLHDLHQRQMAFSQNEKK